MIAPRSSLAVRREDGFTLIELLVAVAITVVVVGGLGQVLFTIFHHSGGVVDRVASSDSALLTSARFDDDVSASIQVGDVPPVSRAAAGCGGDAAALVRLVTRTDAGDVAVTSYHLVGTTLERRVCRGASFSAALAADPATIRVADRLDPAGPPTVACAANAQAPPAPTTPAGDAQCRVVTLRLRTVDGAAFSLRGTRRVDAVAGSAPIVRQCTLVVTDNANVYQDQPDRNFNDRDDYGESPGGRNFIEDRNASGKVIRGYLRFDLAGPCERRDTGEPAFMPPQRTIASATLQLTYHDAAQTSGGVKCSAQHNLDVLALGWDPATLTWNSSPQQTDPSGALRPLRHGFSTVATWVDRPMVVDVLPEVLHWYPAPGGGDWLNQGWVVSDLPNGCDAKDSHKWMSKGSNSSLSPRLVLTWVD